MCDDHVLFHQHFSHVGPFLIQVPGNVGTDQETQVLCSHLIVLAVLTDMFQVRQQIEKGQSVKIFNIND